MSGLEISSRNSVWMLILVLSNCSNCWERRTCNSRCICFLWPFMFRIMIRSTYVHVRLVWIANEFKQVLTYVSMLILVLSNCKWESRMTMTSCVCFLWPVLFCMKIRFTYLEYVLFGNIYIQWCLNVDFDMPLWNPRIKLPTVHRGNPDGENASLVRFCRPIIWLVRARGIVVEISLNNVSWIHCAFFL